MKVDNSNSLGAKELANEKKNTTIKYTQRCLFIVRVDI